MKIQEKIRAKYTNFPHRKKPAAILLIILFCFLIMVLLLKGCHALANSKHKAPTEPMMLRLGTEIKIPPKSPLRSQITIETVHTSNLPHVLSFPGVIEADSRCTVDIRPPLTGRLVSIKVRLGDHVKRNQILAVISSPDLALANSDNDKAQSVLTYTRDALKRAQEVNRAGGNSIKDVQLAQSDYIQSAAEAHRTEAKLKTLGNNRFSLLTMKAPIQGIITALNYGIGSFINDPTVTLMTISNLTKVWVTANIPESLVGVVAQDQPVKIYLPAYPQEVLRGKVTFVNSFLEPDTRRNKTRIAFSNPNGKLQPNMFATVKVSIPQFALILIPVSAILMNDDTTSVYVETAPWIFKRRVVQLGLEDSNQVRVVSGLKTGERIVVDGGVFIND